VLVSPPVCIVTYIVLHVMYVCDEAWTQHTCTIASVSAYSFVEHYGPLLLCVLNLSRVFERELWVVGGLGGWACA
jgi:hypothetical protein